MCRDTGVATDDALITVFKCSFKGAFTDLFSGTSKGIALEKLFVHFKRNRGFIERPYVLSLSLLELFRCGYHTETMSKLFKNVSLMPLHFFFCDHFTYNIPARNSTMIVFFFPPRDLTMQV